MPKTNKNITEVPFSLEKIIQGMPEQAYVLSTEGRLLAWNKNVEIISGYSGDELKNKFVGEFVSKDDKALVVDKLTELLANDDNIKTVAEYRLQTKSGKFIPVIALRSLLVVNDKRYVAGIIIDISKLKNNKEKLDTYIAELTHVKNQLQDHYRKIERLSQSETKLKDRLHFNTEAFNSKLINNMPGIFYAYEKVGEKFFLKKWNKNYTIDLGYPEEELLNKEAHQFFTKKEYEKVKVGVAEVFTTGKAQVEYYTLHKSGKQIPYFYEAYPFEDKGRQYFIGVGLDISDRYALEQKQKRQGAEKRKARKVIEAKERELVATALHISKTSKIIGYTLKRIDELLKTHTEIEICNDLIHIKKDLELQSPKHDNWETFKLLFTEVHKDFFDNLKEKHPSLTKTELKFSAYLRIHLDSSQISSALHVTNEAIRKNRYRIRKKLGLSPKDSLEDYISKF